MSWLSPWLSPANTPGTRSAERPTKIRRLPLHVPLLQIVLGYFRIFCPIPKIFGWAAVTLYEDVEEVLTRADVFTVPFGDEMARLNDGSEPGTAFILGIDDPAKHDAQLKSVMSAFKLSDIEELVAKPAATAASAIVSNAQGRLEAIQNLVTQVPIDICIRYYGVDIPNPRQFSCDTMDVSGHLFGIPPIRPDPKIDVAASSMRTVIDKSLNAELGKAPHFDTVIGRLADLVNKKKMEYNEARAFLIGMIVGFVPTNTMAGGHILDVLLDYPDALEAAMGAAESGDDDLLAHCLFETLRFKPINCGPFRICEQDFILAAGTPRAKKISQGTKLLASTMSAMFDCKAIERPFRFVPGRPASNLMHFGFAMHWCVGAYIARAQITQTFKPLVLKPSLERATGSAGKLKRRGGFPDSLTVTF